MKHISYSPSRWQQWLNGVVCLSILILGIAAPVSRSAADILLPTPADQPFTPPIKMQLPDGTNGYSIVAAADPAAFAQATLTNVPAGYSITNDSFRAWCVDAPTLIYPREYSPGINTVYKPVFYHSYDIAALQAAGLPSDSAKWSKVNYIINNKPLWAALPANVSEIQCAIWRLIGYDANEEALVLGGTIGYGLPAGTVAKVQAILADANANGGAFVPAPGQLVAVVMAFPPALQTGMIPTSLNGVEGQLNIIEVESPKAMIGDLVFNDLNANGIQDGGLEVGISGVTVELFTSANVLAGTTTTTGGGLYSFTVAPGDYYVKFSNLPAGFVFSPSTPGSASDPGDSDANPLSGQADVTTLVANENDPTWDAGIYQPASLGNFVWNDVNHDGIQDSDEPGISGVIVTLTGPGGTQTATTDGTGFYQFTNLIPGTYTVTVGAAPTGFVTTLTGAGTAATDSNPSPATVILAAGDSDQTIDFGFWKPASLGNFVWNDVNHDGIQDSDEPGISGVIVSLTGPGGTQTATTDGTGFYQFTNLIPGTYTVTVGTAPTGFVTTLTGAGTAATDSNPSPATVILAAGDSDQTIDFGFWKPASLGNFVWNDVNHDGIQDSDEPGISGVIVTLTGPGGTQTATTDGTGFYQFTNLIPGTYTVTVGTAPTGFVTTLTGAGTAATDSNPSPATVILAAGDSDQTIDFGFWKPASLGNFVWNDVNHDGIQDSDEPGISGVIVTLTGPGGTQTATTDGTGFYQFTNLIPGTYTVTVGTAPTGFVTTLTGAGTAATDSNPSPATVILAAGDSDQTIDFGFWKPASLGNFVWNDVNHDGIQDSDEPGISGVIVTLTGPGGTQTATTDGTGFYQFTNLIPGTYTVTVGTAPADFVTTLTGAGTAATDSNPSPATVILAAGDSDQTIDFGFWKPTGDLVITKTDGLTSVQPGQVITYKIVASNSGPQDAIGAVVQDTPPSQLTSVSWTSTASGGATDNQLSGTGAINDTVNLVAGSSITYTVTATVLASAALDTSADFGTGTDNTNLGQSITVNGVTAAAFYLSGSSFVSTNTVLWQRNQPSDHGIGVWSKGEPNPITYGGDVNEISNQLNNEVIRLTKPTGQNWTSLWVSSLDSGGSGSTEMGTLYWSNTATPNLSTLTTKFTFKYGDFGPNVVEGNVLSLLAPSSFDSAATYLFWVAGPNPCGTNNDYLFWKATTSTPSTTLTNTATVTGPADFTDTNLANNSATDTDTITAPPPATGMIGNFVWSDANANGTQDSGEPGIAGVLVTLSGPGGSKTATTDAGGFYQFMDLAAGSYTVSAATPSGLAPTTSLAETNRATDSNGSPTTVTLATNSSSDQTIDFGFVAPPPCIPTTFTFAGSTATDGTDGNSMTFVTPLGVSVKVSAFSRDKSNSAWSTAYVGAYSGGLGVTDPSEGKGSGSSHTVDNIGRDNYLLFEFSEPVRIERAFLGYVVTDSDLSLWIGSFTDPYKNHLTLSDSVLSSFGFSETNLASNSAPRWANLNAGGVVGNAIVIAASVLDTTPDDQFKVNMLDVCKPVTVTGTLPSPWMSKNIGNVVAAGTAGFSGGKFTILGSGDNIWNTADAFNYVYQLASGDCSIVARVTGVSDTDPWSKAGVMIRETLNTNSKHVSAFVTPANGVAFQYRNATGGISANVNTTGLAAPYWVKLVRVGNTFTASRSQNGISWTTMGSQTITMAKSVYIGLPVTSRVAGTLGGAVIERVTATP